MFLRQDSFISFRETKMFDEKAAILNAISSDSCGVRELIEKLRWKTERAISTLKTMEEEGLIEFQENLTLNRGRPKKLVVASTLGGEFLETLERCQRKKIQINHNDIKSAVHQASLAKKLEEFHISPYKRFMELNSIALRIRNSITVENSTKTNSDF